MNTSVPAKRSLTLWIKFAVLILVTLMIGIVLGRNTGSREQPQGQSAEAATGKKTVWTCSMHPAIRQSEPGQCPLCGMDLIPAASGEAEGAGPRTMTMTDASMKLAEVRTELVERRFVDVRIPLVGKIDYDERKVKTISAWVPGRLDRLFVDYTGVPVRKGDHLALIYSPALYAAQEELLQAIKAVDSLKNSSSTIVRQSTLLTVKATREKLRLLGITDEQVKAFEKLDAPSATVQINSPATGIVIHKYAKEGMYVKTGATIYTVADLSTVWVILDAYESDIAWLRYGQEVEVKTEAYGDKTFPGWISFIDPILNPKTRTIRIRVVVANSKGLLRPNMFARATVNARVAADGQVVSKNNEDKWICPMHPEVVANSKIQCSACGMDLVPAEDLGYAGAKEVTAPLVIPASAVLTTGERALVYRWLPNQEKPTFQGVEVTLGPRAENFYIVRSGLKEGQRVVTNGNFKIDSALQLMAKPSMMNPQGEGPAPTGHAHHGGGSLPAKKIKKATTRMPAAVSPEFLNALRPLYTAYLQTQQALASDNEAPARTALDRLAKASAAVDMSLAKGKSHMQWMENSRRLTKALEHRAHVADIAALRTLFQDVSKAVIGLEKTFGHTGPSPHRVAFCPMANDNKGTEWLQTEETVSNPYYGSAMLRCGEIRQTLPATNAAATSEAKEMTHAE